jgi:hypothetical protein
MTKGDFMSFKRREYGGHFAMLDIDFVLNDSRLYDLSDAQKWFFVCLWCLAVKERNPNLGPNWSAFKPKVISRYTHVNLKVVKNSLFLFAQLGLTEISPSGEITVCGIKDKHPNLKWKDDPETDNIQFDVIETELELEKEIKKERERETESEKENEKETETEKENETETETESEVEPETEVDPEPDSDSALPKSSCSDDDCGVIDLKRNINTIFNFYIKESGRDPSRYKLTSRRKQKINARLKDGFTVAQMTAAIQAVLTNPWNMGENPQGKRYIELDDHVFNSYEQTEKRLAEFEDKWGKVYDYPENEN